MWIGGNNAYKKGMSLKKEVIIFCGNECILKLGFFYYIVLFEYFYITLFLN